jgi:hypothetical protein
MGDVVMFRPRKAWKLDPEREALLDRQLDSMDREARRRAVVYGDGDGAPEWQRVLSLYPMFRLTHAKRARRCLHCDHRIAPLELHFVNSGAYICQLGCMDRPTK